jgi:selenide, water dikinase
LDLILPRLPRLNDPSVLVGFETSDDAGVYKLNQECALVQTVDFFTPIVDDPFTFGAIAATNSLSDVYAMGGRPLTALSVLCYPGKGDLDDLEQILRGGAEKMIEAGCPIIGGHSVADDEIKFGYSVTGTVHPDRVKANSGARVGDIVLYTKRIGTGVIGTALKNGAAQPAHVDAMIASMLELNKAACGAMLEFSVNGCTDITGFGLLGHTREMAIASSLTFEIHPASIRYLPGAVEYAAAGAIPGGLRNNREFVSCSVQGDDSNDLLYDPQTSGGLLITMPEADAAQFERRFPAAYRIGRVIAKSSKPVILV